MNATPVNDRVAALRARRKAQGLVKVEVYAHADDVEAIKKYADKKRAARWKAGDITASDVYETFSQPA